MIHYVHCQISAFVAFKQVTQMLQKNIFQVKSDFLITLNDGFTGLTTSNLIQSEPLDF